jgi:hypothetical protein
MTYGPPPEPNAYPGPAQPHPQHPGPNYPHEGGPDHPHQGGPDYPQQSAPTYPQQAMHTYPHQAAPTYPHQTESGYPQTAGPNNRQQPGPEYPQHLWPDHAQQPAPGGSPAGKPAKGSGLPAVASLFLGLAGLVAPFLPMAMDNFRQYAAFPFAVPGLALGIAGLIGRRRAQPLAAIGAMVSVLALGIGAYMVLALTFGLF